MGKRYYSLPFYKCLSKGKTHPTLLLIRAIDIKFSPSYSFAEQAVY